MHSFEALIGGDDNAVRAHVVQLRTGQLIDDLIKTIRDRGLPEALLASALVIRLPVETQVDPKKFTADREFEALRELCGTSFGEDWHSAFDRARDRSVHFLASQGGRHFITPNVNPLWKTDELFENEFSEEDILRDIRFAEFTYILDNSRAILSAPERSCYRVPSGRFTQSFIRVGNIQYDRDAIDAVVFWLIGHLQNCAGILIDTWSISTIAMAASRILSQYYGNRPCPVEVLRSYHDGNVAAISQTAESVHHLVQECTRHSTSENNIVCLISASHTGSLAVRLQEALDRDHESFAIKCLTIFSLSRENELDSLHNLSEDSRFELLDETTGEKCNQIHIDPQIYFPLSFVDAIFEINKEIADQSADFFNAYREQNILTVHRTHIEEGVSPRHHAIHIDTTKLADTVRFRSRLESILSGFEAPPSLIVNTPHEAGKKMGQLCWDYFRRVGASPQHFEHANLYFSNDENIPAKERRILEALRALGPDDTILIVDDACITGRRINQFHCYLRARVGETKRLYVGRTRYLVGVARTPHRHIWTDTDRYLGYRGSGLARNSVQAVEKVTLPNWDERRCPWCAELSLYEKLVGDDQFPETLAERKTALAHSSLTGLSTGLFLEFPDFTEMKLGPESLFVTAPATQAESFASVAAALQLLRDGFVHDKPELDVRRFPISTVLRHEDYLLAKWTDSILRASFLRAAHPDELAYASGEAEGRRTTEIARLMMEKTQGEHDVMLEFLLAAVLGKCSLSDTPEFCTSVGNHCTTGTAAFLLKVYQNDRERSRDGSAASG